MSTRELCCYLLTSGNRTYIGYTVDVTRRLRQHNGELKGGAKYTHGRIWKLAAKVTGFNTKREAMSFEWHWKHKTRGLKQRIERVRHMVNTQKPNRTITLFPSE